MENPIDALYLNELYAEARKYTGWMKFLGILLVIPGILTAIFLIGLPILWLGLTLIQAANAVNREGINGLEEFIGKIGLYFKIYGIITVIGILIYVVFLGLMLFGMLPDIEPPGIFT